MWNVAVKIVLQHIVGSSSNSGLNNTEAIFVSHIEDQSVAAQAQQQLHQHWAILNSATPQLVTSHLKVTYFARGLL